MAKLMGILILIGLSCLSFLTVSCTSAVSSDEIASTVDAPTEATNCPQPTEMVCPMLTVPPTEQPTRAVTLPPPTIDYRVDPTGFYRSPTTDHGCALHVDQIAEREVRFEISCMRGALVEGGTPNLGYANGEIPYEAQTALFFRENMGGDDCKLVFEFAASYVKIAQFGNPFDCGFGNGVVAAGVYPKVSSESPELYCLGPTGECVDPENE